MYWRPRPLSDSGPPDYALDNYPQNGALLRGTLMLFGSAKWLHVKEIMQLGEEEFSDVPGPECWVIFEMKHGPILFPV